MNITLNKSLDKLAADLRTEHQKLKAGREERLEVLRRHARLKRNGGIVYCYPSRRPPMMIGLRGTRWGRSSLTHGRRPRPPTRNSSNLATPTSFPTSARVANVVTTTCAPRKDMGQMPDDRRRDEIRAPAPDPPRHRSKKDTRKWCRGEEGVKHVTEIRLARDAFPRGCYRPEWRSDVWICSHEEICVKPDGCGKVMRESLGDECPDYTDEITRRRGEPR